MSIKESLPYREAQSSIRTGDIVFIGGAKSMFSWLISAVTRSSFSHVGIACWMYDHQECVPTLFIVEATAGGRRLVTLDYYGDRRPMNIVESPIHWSKYRADLLAHTGLENYGYFDLIGIGIKEMFGIKTKDFDGQVCSEMVAKMMNYGGLDLDTTLCPGKLYTTLLERGCAVKAITTPK